MTDDLNERIERFKESLTVKEERLYSQFSAMEQMISQLQSESDWLTSQLSSFSS